MDANMQEQQINGGNLVENTDGRTSTKLRSSPLKTKQCAKCGQTKPTKQFKRRLSIAQSRAVLGNPNITSNYMADSKMCKACQPKPKPPRKLSKKEIRTKISSGDMHPIIGEALLKKIDLAIPKRRAKVMKEHWLKVKAQANKELKESIQQQVANFRKRYNYSKNKNLQHATLAQHSWNYQEAKRVRDVLVEKLNKGEVLDPDLRIEMFFNQREE